MILQVYMGSVNMVDNTAKPSGNEPGGLQENENKALTSNQ
jgi:hypothetical protein